MVLTMWLNGCVQNVDGVQFSFTCWGENAGAEDENGEGEKERRE